MKTTKNYIAKETTIVRMPNNLTGLIGRYRVAIRTKEGLAIFETDYGGNLFYQRSSETNPASWVDTGLHCEKKSDFVEKVFNWIN